MAVTRNLRLLRLALLGKLKPKFKQRPDGQWVAQVLPLERFDPLVWAGYSAEVWLEPDKPPTQGRIYREAVPGSLALVLGAGNISSIAPMDALYKSFAENAVVLIKLSPVNDYLEPIFRRAFAPLLEAGYWQMVTGDAAVGQYLCQHPLIESIHVTGSHHTYNAIVWGNQEPGQTPPLAKPVTAELGCVTPVVVVPGQWSAADLAYQARQVASLVVHNGSFNCNAAKLLVLPEAWPQKTAFLEAIRAELRQIPPRYPYYPGAQARYQAFRDRYPQAEVLSEGEIPWTLIPDVPPQMGEYALTTEAFCGILAVTELAGATAQAFLNQAVPFLNEQVWGSLSCMILIDPQTRKQVDLEVAIASLRYGAIGINLWTAVAYGLVTTTWGAFPGHPTTDIQSGCGIVHNACLFDHPQKSVVTAPFRISPIPPWFTGHRRLNHLGEKLCRFEAQPSLFKLPGIIGEALRA